MGIIEMQLRCGQVGICVRKMVETKRRDIDQSIQLSDYTSLKYFLLFQPYTIG